MRRWKNPPTCFRENSEIYFEHQLQLDLHLTDEELARMPYKRFTQWIAFYTVRAEKEAKAHKDTQKKGKSRSKRPLPVASED